MEGNHGKVKPMGAKTCTIEPQLWVKTMFNCASACSISFHCVLPKQMLLLAWSLSTSPFALHQPFGFVKCIRVLFVFFLIMQLQLTLNSL